MVYLILIALLLILAAIIGGFIYAYKNISLPYFVLLLFIFIAIPLGSFKIYERNLMLSYIPDALDVNSISYSEEESWGGGPGGNEAGIIVYPLSEKMSENISSRGIEFFKYLPPNKNHKNRKWRGNYENWLETPIKSSAHWKPKENKRMLEIYDYICAYGFCIDIKPEIVEEANSIVNSEGSYYAYGRIGLIVVCPRRKLVLYFYNG
ncbi:MAG TPA: hypothetical protein DIW64_07250 [Cellvibrio sp.]|nr:hypothetical protein [Cellvibrio sp.]